ncbi:hypothetical protein Glove_24g54 [Diversispora epigaea]|uniref:BTB domain-containing protein n=1 Tax=Diversispora epigaea TaxID=1348612 RepID=A0A397JQH3_9GLOM|nr:hypothetical protein Glove_24g54 [Diversispora epigaea]
MTFQFFDKLSRNFVELLSDKDDFNIIIIVKNEKSFKAHSNVLKCRSPYFRKELKNIIPNENNIKTITKPNISDKIFDIIIKYIYGGVVDLENVETKFIFDLMIVANEFEIEELTKKLENHLIKTKSSWLKSHFTLVYRSIFSENNFKYLEKFCNDIVAKYPNLIFDADDFISLQESALVSLLKRDDLQLEEVVIWEYLIKWGIAQNSTLPVDLKEWTKENFTTLKITLQQCLPLIRYFHISGTDVSKKIMPYKKILDKQLWKDLTQYFMDPEQPVESIILPPRTILAQELPDRATEQAKPLSTIISYEHVAEISSWIDRKSSTYSLTSIPYEFQLIFRGSINGFEPQKFWNICYNHASTVVIMKVKGTEEILGGYNPLAWEYHISGSWAKTNDSFIFSLKNDNLQNSILSRVKKNEYAIWNIYKPGQKTYGIHFGHDLYMYSPSSNFTLDNKSGCNNNRGHYEKPISTTTDSFSIVDYEVFKIIKKTAKFCNYIVAKYPSLIFDAQYFTHDLQLEEGIIWNIYFLIPSTDVSKKKNKALQEILDEQLWEDLTQKILVAELFTRTTAANTLSTIITYEHVAEISSWIDRESRTYSLTYTPYDFQLILRGSINRSDPQTFWDICHGHASTVVIMKVKGTEEILGGYNPLSWDANTSGSYGETNDGFIFSLKNGNVQNSILSRVKNRHLAIYNFAKGSQVYYDPHFGYNLCMYSPSSNFTLDMKIWKRSSSKASLKDPQAQQ